MSLLIRRLNRRRTAKRLGGVVLVGALTAAACAPGQDGTEGTGTDSEVEGEPTQDGESTREEGPASLVVWTDAVRQPGFEAYQDAHPEVELTIEARPDDFQQQLVLANQAGEGWPDVVWVDGGAAIALHEEPFDFAADLTEFVPQEVLDGYAPGILSNCLGDEGGLFCLRNDINPLVLWYDAELMDEFGYEVPTTWEDYEQLALRLVDEHPGYVAGGLPPQVGRSEMAASRCPMHEVVGATTLRVNLEDPKCTRVAALLDNIIEAGALPPMTFTSPEFLAEYGVERKVLMQVGSLFWGKNHFQNNFGWPDGVLGVSPPLRWEEEDEVYNWSHGGGFYMVSRHTEFPQAAAELVTWMATGPYQTDPETFTLPAYGPAQSAWIENNSDFFTTADGDVGAVVEQAIDTLWEGWRDVPMQAAYSAVVEVVVPAVVGEGKTVTEMLPAWEERIINEAEAAGWTVETD